jgi:hypothetical protein
MQPVIEITNNILVVDTGHERVLVDSGFGENSAHPSAKGEKRNAGKPLRFSALVANRSVPFPVSQPACIMLRRRDRPVSLVPDPPLTHGRIFLDGPVTADRQVPKDRLPILRTRDHPC